MVEVENVFEYQATRNTWRQSGGWWEERVGWLELCMRNPIPCRKLKTAVGHVVVRIKLFALHGCRWVQVSLSVSDTQE